MGKKINFNETQIQDIIERYNTGQSSIIIGQEYGVSPQTVLRVLDKNGIVARNNRKHFYNEHIFDEIDSAEKAYWIGFIAADGYVNENRNVLSIKLQGSDRKHLEKFIDFIGGDAGMIKTVYHNITGNELCCAEVNSKYFISTLVNLNLRQGKSTKEQVSPIPQEFVKDYIRGLWDGDGHIDANRIDLVSSVEVLEFVQKYLHDNCYTNINKVLDHCNTHRIYVCKNRHIVLDHLYYDNCVTLDRKYETVKELYRET